MWWFARVLEGTGTICVTMPISFSYGCEQNSLTTPNLGHSPSVRLTIHESPIQRQTQNPFLRFLKLYFSRVQLRSPFNKIKKCNLTFTTRKFVTSWSINMLLIFWIFSVGVQVMCSKLKTNVITLIIETSHNSLTRIGINVIQEWNSTHLIAPHQWRMSCHVNACLSWSF